MAVYRIERRSPTEGGTRLVKVEPRKKKSSSSSSSGGSSNSYPTTTTTKDGVTTTIVRRPASEGGTYSYETSKNAPLPTDIKGGSNESSSRSETLSQTRQEQFNQLNRKQQEAELQKIEEINREARRQQAEFVKQNPYGYTSTSGELVGSNNPQALQSNLYLQKAEEVRRARLEREGNFQTADGRVYNVNGVGNPTVEQYQAPPNYTTESGQVARVSYAPEKPSGRWGGTRIEEYIPPKRNTVQKVEDFLFDSQQVSRTPTAFETGRASVGFIGSTGYYAGKTLFYEVPRAILNPVDTIKGYYTLATSKEARSQLGQSVGWTIQNNPGKATGTALGYILTGKVIKGATKGVQAVDTLLKTSPKARMITYGALGGSALVYALKSPGDALVNSGRVGMAVFIGKVRKSPLSKVQKSQIARGQVRTPKYSTNQGKFIQKTGRANKSRITLQAERTGQTSGRITTENIQKTGRGASRVKQTTTTQADFNAGKLSQVQQYKALDIGKGNPRQLGGKGYSRPPSQVQAPKGVGDGALVVIQRQQQALKNFVLRSKQPNLKQLPNKGQYYTGKGQATVLKQPQPTKLVYNKRTQSYRPVSKREARFQQFKEVLRLKARRRSESKTNNTYGTFYELRSFFGNRKGTSQGVQRTRQPATTKARPLLERSSTDSPLTKSEARSLARKIKAVDKRPSSDVEIIPPQNSKAVRGQSVEQYVNLNSQVGTASAVLTIRPLAERQGTPLSFNNKARVEIINRNTQAERIKPSQALILNRAQAQASGQSFDLAQTTRRTSRSKTQSQTQTRQTDRKVPARLLNFRQPRPPRPIKSTFNPRPPPPERILPRTPFRPPTSSPRQERGFNVLTRKGGVFIQANPLSLSRSEALNFGSNLVKSTARASFKIVETDSPAQGRYRTRGSLLNLEKRRGGVFVEPSKFRINTAGELDQITRKGQKARRSKKRKGWLGL